MTLQMSTYDAECDGGRLVLGPRSSHGTCRVGLGQEAIVASQCTHGTPALAHNVTLDYGDTPPIIQLCPWGGRAVDLEVAVYAIRAPEPASSQDILYNI